MSTKRAGNGALLLAFAAHLLQVEVSTASSSVSASASSTRPTGNSAFRPRRTTSCFVQHEGSGNLMTVTYSGSRRGQGRQIHQPSPFGRISKSNSSTNVHTKNQARVQQASASPRYYISSSEEVDQSPFHNSKNSNNKERNERNVNLSGDEVLIYRDTTAEGEFSLLKPYLEFNELDLQELFSSERSFAASSPAAAATSQSLEAAASSSLTSSLSQLYDELEEVEIAHFQPNKKDILDTDSVVPTSRNSNISNGSPFFFASIQEASISTTFPRAPTSQPTKLPPWLSLNQGRFAPMKLRKLQRDLGPHLSSKEVEQVISAIHTASKGDFKKVAGAADFGSILVNSLEMTDVPALCAAAFHYCSLVSVRERTVESASSSSEEGVSSTITECSMEEHSCLQNAGLDAQYLCALAGSGIENSGTHAVKIALDAARLKSMETLAAAVVRTNGKLGQLHSADARNLRSLLLNVNDEGDWRALAIRSAACLYRLKGLEAHRSLVPSSSSKLKKAQCPTHEESRASQEALHIYAPLAARLGMFRLKTELEDAAFRTLYPHSHAMVSALCGGENTNSVGEGMKSILSDITNQMKRVVQEDTHFMANIKNVSITARVKEPYSIWRKMLKMSKKGEKKLREISILDIPDAVALRVVFSARKLAPDEPDATTRRREKELCYYVLDLCTRNWPEMSDSRFKDYIKEPKDNGYQSLHYSTRKRWRRSEWPFEVQIRSNAMHRVAEYGVAAHWHYKRNDIDGRQGLGAFSSLSSLSRRRIDKTSGSYLKSVQEWRSKQADSDDLLTTHGYEEPAQYLEDEIRRVRKRERDERLAPYLEALSGDQTDMAREHVFVFVSVQPPREEDSGSDETAAIPLSTEGTVISLPRGSRVLDAIRVAEKWSSGLENGILTGKEYVALRNGLRTSFIGTEQLMNGDVVSILPSNELVSSSRL